MPATINDVATAPSNVGAALGVDTLYLMVPNENRFNGFSNL